jgi:hypothetical protein
VLHWNFEMIFYSNMHVACNWESFNVLVKSTSKFCLNLQHSQTILSEHLWFEVYLTLSSIQLHDVVFCLMTLYSVMSRYHFTIALEEHIASIFNVKVSQLSK